MSTHTASEARANLYRLIDEAATSHEAIVITGKRHGNAFVLFGRRTGRPYRKRCASCQFPGCASPSAKA